MSHADILYQIQQLGRRLLPEEAHLLLYGSRARGDYRENSDWDLLVLLNRPQEASDFQNIAYPIMELGFDLGEYFSVQTYSQQEWDAMSFLPYYKNVEQDKIVLVWLYGKKAIIIAYYATEEDTAPRIAKTAEFIDRVVRLIS